MPLAIPRPTASSFSFFNPLDDIQNKVAKKGQPNELRLFLNRLDNKQVSQDELSLFLEIVFVLK